jgi:polysaccharide pyruvyl transferase WcaK-like protein
MHHPDDVDFARRIAHGRDYSIVADTYPPEIVLGIVSRMTMVVAMRLHTLIFAAHTGVPCFALAYDPKVRNLMNRLDLAKSTVEWNSFDPALVATNILDTILHRKDIVAKLQLSTREFESAALRNCDTALEILAAGNRARHA